MTTYDIALIGFGGVNRTLAELIATRGEALRSDLGFGLRVVAITDLRLGSLVQSEGIDLSMALNLGSGGETFAEHGGSADTHNESVIRTCTADIICEATYTNPEDGEPAVSHVRWALEAGKSVCTTNKGPVALRGAELTSMAEQNGVHFEFEGAVMSGTPVIRLARRCSLASAERLRRHPQRHQQLRAGADGSRPWTTTRPSARHRNSATPRQIPQQMSRVTTFSSKS